MTANLDDTELHERARTLLALGKLPSREASVTWAGSGRGDSCCVCRLLVRADEIGFDLSFGMPGRDAELHMHSRCRIAWERERGIGSTPRPS